MPPLPTAGLRKYLGEPIKILKIAEEESCARLLEINKFFSQKTNKDNINKNNNIVKLENVC